MFLCPQSLQISTRHRSFKKIGTLDDPGRPFFVPILVYRRPPPDSTVSGVI